MPRQAEGVVSSDALPLPCPQDSNLPVVTTSINLRDISNLGNACHVKCLLKPGIVYRSSQIVSHTELAALHIKSVLDLRKAPILCKAQHRNVWQTLKRGWMAMATSCLGCCKSQQKTNQSSLGKSISYSSLSNPALEERNSFRLQRYSEASNGSSRSNPSSRQPLVRQSTMKQYEQHMKHAAPCWRCTAACDQQYGVEAVVYHVDMLPGNVNLRIFLDLPKRLQAKVLVCVLQGARPEPIVAGAIADPGVMGYVRMYQIVLEHSKHNLARALRLFCDASNLPVLVHCIHGKDRTGLVVMLLLLLCGVDKQLVMEDYAVSEVLLKEGRANQHLTGISAYLTTDQVMASSQHVMGKTIDHLVSKYGSIRAYALDIGLTPREIAAIRRNLMHDAVEAGRL